MVLTEQEASTKLCPRVLGPGTPEWETVPARRVCAGSQCMAWRWEEWNLDPVDRHRVSGKSGYCGLAGRP